LFISFQRAAAAGDQNFTKAVVASVEKLTSCDKLGLYDLTSGLAQATWRLLITEVTPGLFQVTSFLKRRNLCLRQINKQDQAAEFHIDKRMLQTNKQVHQTALIRLDYR
jgi:hypothetical protein